MQISQSQQLAISHGKGPAIVLAGPGSGKTLVITHRIRHLIRENLARPDEILVITFTKAAALQMKERYQKMTGQSRTEVTFGTFHAVFFHILSDTFGYTGKDIILGREKADLLHRIAALECDMSDDADSTAADLSSQISYVKNEQIQLEYYYSTSFPEETFRRIFRRYEKELEERRKIDFDDILIKTRKLLLERPDILDIWRKRWRYLLVDEFQDINVLQYQTLKMLCAGEKNLFVVGDDDQSIYRFRGSRPEIMLRFEKEFPGCAKLYLTENYRSTQPVVSLADHVIRKNTVRYCKEIRCMGGSGDAVDIRQCQDPAAEALAMIREIRQSVLHGRDYREIAILTRTNTAGRYIAQKLSEFQIPYYGREKIPLLYDHWIVRDVLCYVRMSQGLLRRADLLCVLNKPMRGLPRDLVNDEIVSFENMISLCAGRSLMQESVKRFALDLHTLQTMPPFAAVNYIRKGIGYDRYIEDYARYRKIDVQDLTGVLEELQEDVKTYRSWEEWIRHMEESRKAENEERQHDRNAQEKAAVTLTTYHGSKGLEFEEVFLPDCNEGMIPWKRLSLKEDVEEERRLFYVGITRAKQKLHIWYVRERYGKLQKMSSFLEGIKV